MIDYTALEDNQLQQLSANGDRNAEDALAERYLRLVRACARPLFLAGGDSEDLIQEGTFGLLSAIRNYSGRNDVPDLRRTLYSHASSFRDQIRIPIKAYSPERRHFT